jgi:hypothetical protein
MAIQTNLTIYKKSKIKNEGFENIVFFSYKNFLTLHIELNPTKFCSIKIKVIKKRVIMYISTCFRK